MSLTHTVGPAFIRPSQVIERLKTARTSVGLSESDFHILGAGDFIKATESGTFAQNANVAIYVINGNSSSALITDAGLGSNEVLHTIDIVLYIRTRDNRAQYSDQLSVWFKEFLAYSLVGYNGDIGEPLTFGGDSFNATENVASYSRTFQFNQRVFIDGQDLIGDGDFDDLDDLETIFNTINAECPDFGDITPDIEQSINFLLWRDFKTWTDTNTWND
jgi:hypothetical protein